MIQINKIGDKYRIKFSDPGTGFKSYTHEAVNFGELTSALEHHLGKKRTLHTEGKVTNCPLCRSEQARTEVESPDVKTFKGVVRFAESRGLIFDRRVQREGGKAIQRYEITDNDKSVTACVLTLTEAVQEIQHWY